MSSVEKQNKKIFMQYSSTIRTKMFAKKQKLKRLKIDQVKIIPFSQKLALKQKFE
jgi:hypothetical protein